MTSTSEDFDSVIKKFLRESMLYDFNELVTQVDRSLHGFIHLRDLPEYRSAVEALRAYADAIDKRIDEARRTGK